jgi:5-methylthioadenosine/S-adenosylhomocysteine deaminase
LTDAGVNLCLGTDSLATVRKTRDQPCQLSMFEEMRALAANEPGLPPKAILEMATLNGARALGMAGKIGALEQGGFADLIAIPCNGKMADSYDHVIHHAGSVTGSLIGGQWAVRPPTA